MRVPSRILQLITLLTLLQFTSAPATELPPKVVGLHSLILQADQAFQAKDWQQYASSYQALTQLSPQRGEYWYRLGVAQQQLAQRTKAEQAFLRAIDLGYKPARANLQLAKLAVSDNAGSAANYFSAAKALGLTHAEQELLGSPELSPLTKVHFPQLPKTATDAQRWQADLAFLAERVQQSAYADSAVKTRVQHGLLQLAGQSVNDEQRLFALMKWLRLLNSGHTQLYPPFQGPLSFHAAPLRLQFFADGLYVTAAGQHYQQHLGRKVTHVACLTAEQWLEQSAEFLPHDSASGLKFIASLLMVVPEYSRALGCNTGKDQLQLQFAGMATPTLLAAAPLSMEKLQQMLAITLPDTTWQAVTTVKQPLSVATASHIGQNYWYTEIPDSKLVYWQFNQLREDETQSLHSFLTALGEAVCHAQKGLILDLRQNNGGNGELVPSILAFLLRENLLAPKGEPARLTVLTNGRTFSAAVLLAADLAQYNAIFVGEPTGAGAVHVGEDNVVMLPNTGLAVALATRLFVRSTSDDKQPTIPPHVQVIPSFREHLAGEDIALNTAQALLTNKP